MTPLPLSHPPSLRPSLRQETLSILHLPRGGRGSILPVMSIRNLLLLRAFKARWHPSDPTAPENEDGGGREGGGSPRGKTVGFPDARPGVKQHFPVGPVRRGGTPLGWPGRCMRGDKTGRTDGSIGLAIGWDRNGRRNKVSLDTSRKVPWI